jgi:DNA-binding CsgD family transcriptional regulator
MSLVLPPGAWPPSPAVGGVLSGRERQILALLGDGLTGEEIARHLFISPETVRTHIRNAKRKLHARTRTHAFALALRSSELD